ncbi:MAG: hypothetical protein IPG57_09825 [Burkholderiales bacterium]|nr:hypothetical protein [Burkholderiales bacterium]
MVRIYPDDIHVDSHDPALSLGEISLQQKFFKTLASEQDEVEWQKAWRALAHAVGPLRALWLATSRSSVNRPAGWTRGAIARLLPDRFVAFAWTDFVSDFLVAHVSHPVRERLALGADPMRDDADATRPLGADALWLHDFSAALAAGMALEVSVNPAERIKRLVVIGVRASADPAAQAIELARLLDAHRCTSGLSLLAPGEPTNALGETRTAYRVQPDVDQVYRDELAYWGNGPGERPASWEQIGAPGQRFEGEESAGFRLDRALGLVPGTLGRLAGSDDEWAAQERVLRSLLANVVTSGIEYMLAPSVSSEAIGSALKHFRRMSAGGPLATIRMGLSPTAFCQCGCQIAIVCSLLACST